MTDGPVAGPGATPAGMPTGGAPSLLVSYDAIDPAISACRLAAETLDTTRARADHALAEAAGAAGFPGLSQAVAAFADVANGHLSKVATAFSTVAAQVSAYKAHLMAIDRGFSGSLVQWPFNNLNSPYPLSGPVGPPKLDGPVPPMLGPEYPSTTVGPGQ